MPEFTATPVQNLWIACHECDLLHRKRPLQDGQTARCSRCGATLYQKKKNSIERALALTSAAFIFLCSGQRFSVYGHAVPGTGTANHHRHWE